MNQNTLSEEPFPIRYGKGRLKKRQFTEIPIIASTANGFGDVMNTLKLAEGLNDEFPDKDVCVYFQNSEGYRKIGQLYPSFDSESRRQKLNGIYVAIEDKERINDITNNQAVSVYSLMIAGPQPSIDDFLMESDINIYLQEYDAERYTGNPGKCYGEDETGFGGLKPNILYEDLGGRKHLIMPTGFSDEGIGIHIDKNIMESSTEENESKEIFPNKWTKILYKDRESLSDRSIADYLDDTTDTATSTWGFSYANPHYSNDCRLVDGLDNLVHEYLREEGDLDKRATIFDFSEFRPESLISGQTRRTYRNTPFKHSFISDKSYNEIYGELELEGKPRSNVEIVHLGTQPQDVFLEFLEASELPPIITGDASLSEVVSMGKPFIYDARRHKRDVVPNFVDFARKRLDTEELEIMESVLQSNWNERDQRLEYTKGVRDIFNPRYKEITKKLYTSICGDKDIVKNLATLIIESLE